MIIDDTHPWTSRHRVPVLTSDFDFINLIKENVGYNYALVLIPDDSIEALVHKTTVTEDEAFILGAYIEYLVSSQPVDVRNAMRIMNSVDIHPDFDTIGVCKTYRGQWFYRRASWDTGVFYPNIKFSISLLELIDDIEISEETGKVKEEWLTWKKRYSLFED